jgi:hypothetical protein
MASQPQQAQPAKDAPDAEQPQDGAPPLQSTGTPSLTRVQAVAIVFGLGIERATEIAHQTFTPNFEALIDAIMDYAP